MIEILRKVNVKAEVTIRGRLPRTTLLLKHNKGKLFNAIKIIAFFTRARHHVTASQDGWSVLSHSRNVELFW
jgi:hypothetical protein